VGGNATLPFAGGAPYRVCIKMDGTDVMGGAKCERVVLCDLECVLRDEADKVQSPDDCLPCAAWDIPKEDYHYMEQARTPFCTSLPPSPRPQHAEKSACVQT
jgi:hypothetical protein